MVQPTKTERKSKAKNLPKIRDKAFYMQQIDIEDAMFKRATSIAERIFTAFVRENNIEIKVDANDLADQIIERMGSRLQTEAGMSTRAQTTDDKKDGFKFDDDEPIIIKSEKVEIKGDLGKVKKSNDSIDEQMDALENFKL